jgi:hypothetical protein
MKTPNLNNYVNLLTDVYAYGSISTALCRKHRLSNATTRTLKELRYVDQKGKSLIRQRPSVQDAKKVIAKNRERAKQYQSPNKQPVQTEMNLVTPKAPLKGVQSRGLDIDLFWGMIKIKR